MKNTFYYDDPESECLKWLSSYNKANLLQNHKIYEEATFVNYRICEIIADSAFMASTKEAADFLCSISHKQKPDIKNIIWIQEMAMVAWSLTREEALPRAIKKIEEHRRNNPEK